MTTIPEEYATLEEFFDFGRATGQDEQDTRQSKQNDNSQPCPLHSGIGKVCVCETQTNWDASRTELEANYVDNDGLDAADFAKVQDWIPCYVKPDQPCDYCRAQSLICIMSSGKALCNACEVLQGTCSSADINLQRAGSDVNADHEAFLTTMSTMPQDGSLEQRGPPDLVPSVHQNTTASPEPEECQARMKPNVRFSRVAVKILREWLDSHAADPYPTEKEKEALHHQTGLKSSQISTWLANARRRSKLAKPVQRKRGSSPRPTSLTSAIDIINGTAINGTATWDELNPLERWQHSPPEHEPAPMSAIADAVASCELPVIATDGGSASPSVLGDRRHGSSNRSGISGVMAPSITSQETGQTTSQSGTSSAAWSGSHGSFQSFGSFSSGLNGKKDRRRRRKPTLAMFRKASEDRKRMFQCTFCTDTFKSKYDWTRHEKSLHLSLEKWICAPLGPVITCTTEGTKICVYCRDSNPTHEHIESHSNSLCYSKGIEARTFFRKDHLRQHLRLMHNCEMIPAMEAWKASTDYIKSRCGFCKERFVVWQERVDHLAAHFKEGAQMKDWSGCRGLDPSVAVHVTHAMPPYLIGLESISPDPFSATKTQTCCQSCQGWTVDAERLPKDGCLSQPNDVKSDGRATCWEILTVRLGRFAKEQADLGAVMTDDMLQRQARIMLYGTDDAWNHTPADNPEWLDLFKKAHGLDYIPSTVGGVGRQIPEDLEFYGDLGLRIPFSVQLARGTQPEPLESCVPRAIEKSVSENFEHCSGSTQVPRTDIRGTSPTGMNERCEQTQPSLAPESPLSILQLAHSANPYLEGFPASMADYSTPLHAGAMDFVSSAPAISTHGQFPVDTITGVTTLPYEMFYSTAAAADTGPRDPFAPGDPAIDAALEDFDFDSINFDVGVDGFVDQFQ